MNKKLLLFAAVVFVAVIFTTACGKNEKNSTKRNGYDYLVLVNKYSRLPDDWEKKVKLVKTKDAWDEELQIEKETYENYLELEKDLEADGVDIELDSVYRSVADQQDLWDRWSNDPEKGIDYVKKFVAVPGYSEHHTGLAVDICLKKDGELVYDNDEMIADKDTFKKIHKKLANHGFILRYADGRESVTGYTYEPWHFRYVGSSEIAKEIMDKDLTLEEYLGLEDDLVNNLESAKYKLERRLQEYFEQDIYKDKITNERFNVKKIYTKKDGKKDQTIKDLKLGKDDFAFDVVYEILPADGVDINELMIPDGEYNETTGWITGIQRVGVARVDSKTGFVNIESYGTGW